MVVSEAAAAGHAYDGYGLEPAWSTEQVPGQPKLHRETLSWNKNGPFSGHRLILFSALAIEASLSSE